MLSYDEKPHIQAVGGTGHDRAPVPGKHSSWLRDYEYVRHGTVSLLAGIDLLTGHVHGLVAERHRSREFIEFLRQVDQYYPAHTRIRLILDNLWFPFIPSTFENVELAPIAGQHGSACF